MQENLDGYFSRKGIVDGLDGEKLSADHCSTKDTTIRRRVRNCGALTQTRYYEGRWFSVTSTGIELSGSSPVGPRRDIWDVEIECSNHSYPTDNQLVMKKPYGELMRKELNEMDFEKNLSLRQGSVTFDNPVSFGLQSRKLEEGLIHTYPIDTTIRYISEYFGMNSKEIFKGDGENGYERIFVKMYDDKRNHAIMNRAMNLCGYFPSHFSRHSDGYVVVQYESRNDKDISAELRGTERYLTHITPSYNEEKILSGGFSPMAKNHVFNFPDRVYFSVGSAPSEESLQMIKMLSLANVSEGNNGKYTVFKVDLRKIPEDVKFFRDQNYKNGIYTKENVRPDCIVGKIHIDANEI